MLPREILNFNFSKIHIWYILGENLLKSEAEFSVKIACV